VQRLNADRLVRWSGIAGLIAGAALIAGQLSFWLVVPESDEVRAEREAWVFGTAMLWLLGHALLAPAIGGIYSQVQKRVGAFGGAGAAMAVLGTIGICFYVFFLFPELIGFRPDTIDEAQVALALEAIGELGAALLLAGLFLLSLTMALTRAFAPAAAALIGAGALVSPFGLGDLGWLALGACLVGAGVIWMSLLLASGRSPSARRLKGEWPRPIRDRQFRF
jgi:hypothetical protein